MMTFPIYGKVNFHGSSHHQPVNQYIVGESCKKKPHPATLWSGSSWWRHTANFPTAQRPGKKTCQAALRERATENASRFNSLLCPVYLYNLVYIYIILYIVYSQLLIYVCITDTQNISPCSFRVKVLAGDFVEKRGLQNTNPSRRVPPNALQNASPWNPKWLPTTKYKTKIIKNHQIRAVYKIDCRKNCPIQGS